MLERWYARLQRCRSCDGRRIAGHVCRPLSSSTVRKIHFIVSGALSRAIAADLRQQIQDGRLAPGSFVPTTNELATAYNVSIATSHRAVAVLNSEGLIEVSRGRRAVVRALASDL